MCQIYMTQSLTYSFPLLCQFWDGAFLSFHHRDILCFSEVHFTKDLHQYLFSQTKRNPKRIFTFKGKKRARRENSLQYSLCSKPLQLKEAASRASSESSIPQLLLQELNSASQHQADISLNHIGEHLCFILFPASISKMCPKVIASSLYAISAYKGLPGKLLSDNVGNYMCKSISIKLKAQFNVCSFRPI